VILSLDGEPAEEVLARVEALISGATPPWRRHVALLDLARGEQSEPVQLEVRPLRGGAFTTTLLRWLPVIDREDELEDPRPGEVAEILPGILYVNLRQISFKDLLGALYRAATAQGVIFDLRGYRPLSDGFQLRLVVSHLTGGDLALPRRRVPVFHRPDQKEVEMLSSQGTLEARTPPLSGRIAFLTDGGTIGDAEACLAAAERLETVEIVGGPTAGTIGDVNTFPLPGTYEIHWTQTHTLKPDSSRLHGIGVVPTVPWVRTIHGIIEGRDEVLERAIAVVSQH